MVRSADEALDWARGNPRRRREDGSWSTWSQWCQSFIVRALGLGAAGDANQACLASDIVSKDPSKAPKGAIHWWLNRTRSSGHVGISFGGGVVLMTDAPAADQWPKHNTVGLTTVSRYNAKGSGYIYQGWSLDMAGQRLKISIPGTVGAGLLSRPIIEPADAETEYEEIMDRIKAKYYYEITERGEVVKQPTEYAAAVNLSKGRTKSKRVNVWANVTSETARVLFDGAKRRKRADLVAAGLSEERIIAAIEDIEVLALEEFGVSDADVEAIADATADEIDDRNRDRLVEK